MAIIGIPLRYSRLEDGRCILYLEEKIRRTIQKAGGFVLPICQVQDYNYTDTKFNEFSPLTKKEKQSIEKYLDLCDGVIFPGGHKITPFDRYLLERCIDKNIKTLGICLGMQLMSCYKEEFKVYKNDNSNHFQNTNNNLSHKIKIKRDSKLHEIIGLEEIMVNSFHNYHVQSSQNYFINATSEDGYIEGIELKEKDFHIGIQWHPEISYDYDDNSRKIIDYFIKECEKND